MNFPLYDSLKKGISKKELTEKQKNLFIKKINTIDFFGHEMVYVLIQNYYFKNETETKDKIPYKGQILKKNITWNLENLPLKLQKILYKFLNMHVKRMKEDKYRLKE